MKYQPYLLIFHIILVVGGFIAGVMAWLFLPDMLINDLRNYTLEQIDAIAITYSWKDVFLSIVTVNTMDMFRIYFCGLCLLGIPILIVFLFLKSFSIGFTACILLQSSLLLLITRMLFIPILMFSVMNSFKFSLSLLQNNLQNPIKQILYYTAVYVGLLICVLLTSAIDCIANYYYLSHM